MFHNSYQSGVISILSAYGSNPLQLWDITLDQSTENSTVSGRVCRVNSSSDDGDDVKEVCGPAIEISGEQLSTNYMTCPPTQRSTPTSSTHCPSLGIKLPYLNLIVHVPSQADFSIEVTILDDKQTKRRFRASTYQSTTVIKPDICTFPLKLERQHTHLVRDSLLIEEPAEKKQKCVEDYELNGSYYGPQTNDDDSTDDEYTADSNYKTQSCWNNICIPLAEYTRLAYGTTYQETVSIQIHPHCYLKRVYFSEKQMNEDDELPEEFRLYSLPSSS